MTSPRGETARKMLTLTDGSDHSANINETFFWILKLTFCCMVGAGEGTERNEECEEWNTLKHQSGALMSIDEGGEVSDHL